MGLAAGVLGSLLTKRSMIGAFALAATAATVGTLATGVFVDPLLGGTGMLEYGSKPGEAVSTASYSRLGQFATQTWSVATVAAWTAGVSLLLFAIAALGRRARKAPAIPA